MAFEPFGYLLTAQIEGNAESIEKQYDIELISQYLDIININTWIYRGPEDGTNRTAHHAPLYARLEDEDKDKINTVV